ncbi:hypothetical protein MKD49_16450 [Herbaspirillum sp. WGmk3]|uniref:hypothetical protein n=1 Tax=Herbaspirillum sp. WGmk3 TaxID=2919925 RepID=UPI0020904609|nr:hypothetical protein [Herbaspirillum sp. WGmk3]MCO4858083.1 hypothetical protein [Herbaspirillum sp. WGmk3]
MMLNSFAEDIAGRYVLIVRKLAEMAGANLIVGDLIRSATRNCLVAMHAAGSESHEIRHYLGALIAAQTSSPASCNMRSVAAWISARNHMEFLLFIEEREALMHSAGLTSSDDVTLH